MKLKMEDLVDIPLLQEYLDKLNEVYIFPSAIIDNDGKILTATAWQDLCTKFHRVNPVSEQECIISDRYITEHLKEANPSVTYECPHGLIDNAIPIVIGGNHIANFFTGQIFLKEPDMAYFEKQSKIYGFDEEKYLEAVRKVPVWNEEKLTKYLDFINTFIRILTDIGEKKLFEIESNRKLKESESKFRAVFENSFDAIGVSWNGIHIFVNNAFKKLFGIQTDDEVIGKSILDIIAHSQKETIAGIIERRIRNEDAPSQYETTGLKKDGTEFIMEVRASFFDLEGKKHTLVILRDVTQHKTMLEKLSLSEAKFRQTFDLSPVGAAMVSLDKRFHRVNIAFANFLGYSPEELYGMTIESVTFEEDRHIGAQEIKMIVMGELDSARLRVRYLTKNGSIVWGEITISLVRDSGGNPLYFLPIIQDITLRKNAEMQLFKLNENLEQKVLERTEELNKALIELENTNLELKELNDAISKESVELVKLNDRLAQSEMMLRQANETKDMLFSIIAHDLKNPLQALLFSSGILARNIDNYNYDTVKQKMRQFNKTTGELSELLDNMLNWSRSQSGRILFQPEKFDFDRLIHDTIELYDEFIRIKNIKIEFNSSVGTKIFADKNLMGAVIRNLISNAVKFSAGDGVIRIESSAVDGTIHFCVSDNGAGMGGEELAALFRAEASASLRNKNTNKGTGLGLIICKDFIDKHGGSIWAESSPGIGSDFHFTIPVKSDN